MRHLISAFGLMLAAIALPVFGDTGEALYLVLELDNRTGAVSVIHEQIVPRDRELRTSPGGTSTFAALDGEGRTLLEGPLRFDHEIRAELSNGPDGSIEGTRFPAAKSVTVLRVPVETKHLAVSGERFGAQNLTLAGPVAFGKGSGAEVIELETNGPSSNRVDLLIVAEGYTEDERAKFEADFVRISDQFFGISPYSEYRNFVNVIALFVGSPESGADHPRYRSDCDMTQFRCCPDVSAARDPKEGQLRDTAFDATFCSNGIQRLLTVDAGKVLSAAAAAPEWDLIGVIVNDDEYGGAGGYVWTTSTNKSATAVAQHEYGHSFTRLADEYTIPYPGYPPCSDKGGHAPCQVNVTDETSRTLIKWGDKIEDDVPVPTPSSMEDVIGLFEGARYQTEGMFRSEYGCAMRSLEAEFCEVCSEAYVARLYGGGWGEPYQGVALIEPGSVAPLPGLITGVVGAPVEFSVEVLSPSEKMPARVTWLVNGEVVDDASETFTIVPAGDGVWYVELIARDADVAAEHLRWTVVVGEPGERKRGARR